MKNKIQKNWIIYIIVFFGILMTSGNIFASEVQEGISGVEYSEEYLNWLQLEDEQKVNSIMPRMYKVRKDMSKSLNPIKAANLVGASIETRFNLNSYISDNLGIRDQGAFGACWSFSSIASLESNLAMIDYQNKRATKIYDFSEMHMIYTTSTSFLNGQKPDIKFNRRASIGAHNSIAAAYLTNGTGPIEEQYMRYDDTATDIDISTIKNKTLGAQIYDIAEFPTLETSTREELKVLLREHIKNNGGVMCSIHESGEPGGNLASGECPNPNTGAIYCNNALTHTANHGVVIVGWDDNYSINNFTEGYRPKNNGAWIAKDSHGDDESRTLTFDEIKQINFNANKEAYLKVGITSYTQISDDAIIQLVEGQSSYKVDKNKREVVQLHNDDGYLYISYEDVNVYSTLMGISKSDSTVSYDNVYQHNPQGVVSTFTVDGNNTYLANVFDKKTSSNEYITQVSLNTPETVTCKVYVNPKNDSRNKKDLQLVKLKSGETQTIDPGYHTLEFLNPLQITGSKFVVVVEIQGKRTDAVDISVLYNLYNEYTEYYGTEPKEGIVASIYKDVEINPNECFIAFTSQNFNNNQWFDLGKTKESYQNMSNSASSIKAFTVNKINVDPTPTPTPTNPEDCKPKNTDFSTANCVLTGLKYYTFSDSSKDSYVIMGTAIDSINRIKENDDVEYYYYLSGNPNETDITEWIKIKEQQLADNKLLFDINTNNVKDVYELGKNEKLYVYIKEVAKKENNESFVISKSLLVKSNIKDSEVEVYVDNVKANNLGSGNGQSPVKPTDDPTVSKNKLPYTGVKTIAIIMIIVVAFGVYQYIRYKNLSKYIK